MENEIGMKSVRGESMTLRSVHIEGQINGLMLSTSIRQHYHNDSGKPLEIVYTFPIGHGVTLLGMDADIGGKRLKAAVIEKRQAEQKYEKAIDEGDTPVMVQEASPGLYTANLGNIKQNESVSIEIHCGQLLRFEQGRIRVKIPTVIAPRYGDAHRQGGLAPHETDAVDLTAEYPLTVRMQILGATAKAKVTSPSHAVSLVPREDGITVFLESGAMLDRDFILLLEGLAGHAFAVTAHDAEEHMMLASFCPQLPQDDGPLALKILVDCSGSMIGDSIRQAKAALASVFQALRKKDYISYSRFGSDVKHEGRRMERCAGVVLRRLSHVIAATEADMGGTEMVKALRATIDGIETPESLRACLLLITDDLTWDAKRILQTCLDSGHRIFAIGVGSAPAESLLRDMCELTGGACEFVAPNEEISMAATRMLRRMKGAQPDVMRISWGTEPRWQSPLPLSLFDGETLHVFAAFGEAPDTAPELFWEEKGQTRCAGVEKVDIAGNSDLIRLGAARRMLWADKKEALALALKHRLVSAQTSFFLVHLREGEDKVTELPELRQIPQMMAAGSHGYGTAFRCCGPAPKASAPRDKRPAYSLRCAGPPDDDMYISRFPSASITNSTRPESASPDAPESPAFLLEHFEQMVLANKSLSVIVNVFASISAELREFGERIAAQEGLSSQAVWVALLDWLLDRLAATYTPSRQTRRLLRTELKHLNTAQIEALRTIFATTWPMP